MLYKKPKSTKKKQKTRKKKPQQNKTKRKKNTITRRNTGAFRGVHPLVVFLLFKGGAGRWPWPF